MKSHSRQLLTALCVSALLVLSACTKPLPGATVQSGTKSVHAQALCWNLDQNKLRDCLTSLATNPNLSGTALRVGASANVGISVDPKATEFGWQALLNGTSLVATPISSTYYRFSLPKDIIGSENNLEIVALGPQNSVRGVWLFKLAVD